MSSETDLSLLETLKRSAGYQQAFKQIEQEAERENLAKRKPLVDKLHQLAIEAPQICAPLQQAAADAQKRVERARVALKAAEREHNLAASAAARKSDGINAERAELKKQLLESASPAISAFATEMEEAWEAERHVAVSVNRDVTDQFRPSDPNMHRIVETSSNADVKHARLEALRAAQTVALEQLPFEALTGDEVAARLKQLRDSLPPRFGD